MNRVAFSPLFNCLFTLPAVSNLFHKPSARTPVIFESFYVRFEFVPQSSDCISCDLLNCWQLWTKLSAAPFPTAPLLAVDIPPSAVLNQLEYTTAASITTLNFRFLKFGMRNWKYQSGFEFTLVQALLAASCIIIMWKQRCSF